MDKGTVSIEEVIALRARIKEAQKAAGDEFRDSFDANDSSPPNERWRSHLEIQASALIGHAEFVRFRPGYEVRYSFLDQRTVVPVAVAKGAAPPEMNARFSLCDHFYPFFEIPNAPAATLEYWMIVSELTASPSWNVTWLVATREEFSAELGRMTNGQLLKPLWVKWLPEVTSRDDGTKVLDVCVYTRAGEERIERRSLVLDRSNELHFHGRELIAEGRGGVPV